MYPDPDEVSGPYRGEGWDDGVEENEQRAQHEEL